MGASQPFPRFIISGNLDVLEIRGTFDAYPICGVGPLSANRLRHTLRGPLLMSSVTPTVPPEVPPLIGERRTGIRRFVLGVLTLLVLFIAWQVLTRYVVYTDDAYVRSDLIALAPQVTGRIVTVAVTDNQVVRRGDLLIEIDSEPFQLAVNANHARLEQADAIEQAGRASKAAAHDQLASATAQSVDAQDMEKRLAAFGQSGAFSRDEEDAALATSQSSQARVAAGRATIDRTRSMLGAQQAEIGQAQAELASAEWRLSKTKIFAPMDGTISNLNVQVGDTANADRPLIGIIAAGGWRVVANYKQSYLPSIHPGATAWVWLDAHPWHFYRGRIRSIGRGIDRQRGDSGLLPYIAPTTDWIRLQHRFPVTVDLVDPPSDLTLYMGADARTVILP
jgi:multidrug efflux system membrane fusion protein